LNVLFSVKFIIHVKSYLTDELFSKHLTDHYPLNYNEAEEERQVRIFVKYIGNGCQILVT